VTPKITGAKIHDDTYNRDFAEVEALGKHPTCGCRQGSIISKPKVSRACPISRRTSSMISSPVGKPPELTPKRLLRTSPDLPLDWSAQRAFLGFT
jgi:hypothetical protein